MYVHVWRKAQLRLNMYLETRTKEQSSAAVNRPSVAFIVPNHFCVNAKGAFQIESVVGGVVGSRVGV